MPRALTQVRCPNCKAPVQAALEQLIDVGEDPSAKARLLSGSLNMVRCPACGFEGALSAPLVYHDASKELLLTYCPVELGLKKDDQERMLGQLINQVANRLPPEKRKAYLLQPQAILTQQGLLERILAADGVTKEQLEGQRARLRLFEDLLRTPESELNKFVEAHDPELNPEFFQLASLSLQATAEPRAREAAMTRLEQTLDLTSYGKVLTQQEAEITAAAESLRQAGKDLTRERLLELMIQAPGPERVLALAGLARPALDYSFFQLLSDRIDTVQGDEKTKLGLLRQQLLDFTQQMDKLHEARAAQSASLLRSILQAPDLDRALDSALPYIDDLFLGILEANLRAARERNDATMLQRLEALDRKLRETVERAMPAGLRLAQKVLDVDDEAQAQSMLEAEASAIDDQLVSALLGAAQKLDEAGQTEDGQRVRRLYKTALRLSMQAKSKGTPPASAG
ncbi:MAG: CpXC domain-containing protein [Chloroflexi bacterium]|nr:CpXC domain-containing protein [Chloroflexota bacterium]